jgi:putative ABC transport system substrate-binding protein
MYPFRYYVDAGGLMAYGPSVADMAWRVASYVDKILKGAKPADLPVEQAMKFELVFNLEAARPSGLRSLPCSSSRQMTRSVPHRAWLSLDHQR